MPQCIAVYFSLFFLQNHLAASVLLQEKSKFGSNRLQRNFELFSQNKAFVRPCFVVMIFLLQFIPLNLFGYGEDEKCNL